MKSFAIWNNKGGIGKTYLSFALGTEYARKNPDSKIILVDMCPQANLSEVILGGNGKGADALAELINKRMTIGGYFDTRINNPHNITGGEQTYLLLGKEYNAELPDNLYLISGDPSLEIQAQAINQLSNVSLPEDSWRNIHLWLKDLVSSCASKLGQDKCLVIIDCNPSFAAYTEQALIASSNLLVPCSSDGSSARAIDNLAQLIYGIGINQHYKSVNFSTRCKKFNISLPVIHSVILNRSTQYNKEASKAFSALFREIKRRVDALKVNSPQSFQSGEIKYFDIPDNHSVAVVSSHLGLPIAKIKPGRYTVHDTSPQINPEPLDRYKSSINELAGSL